MTAVSGAMSRLWVAGRCLGVVLALVVSFISAGCDNKRIAATQPGLTTETEVLSQWGQPENVWINPQGQRVLEYNRQPNGHANYMITVGSDGRVVSLRNVLTPATFAEIRPGMHIEDVRKLLGRPASVVPYELKGEIVYEWRWREEAGASPDFRRFVVTTDRQFIVTHTADVKEPTHSEHKR